MVRNLSRAVLFRDLFGCEHAKHLKARGFGGIFPRKMCEQNTAN